MSKKDYIAIAKIFFINNASEKLINDFCNYFHGNKMFDSNNFKIFIKNLKFNGN